MRPYATPEDLAPEWFDTPPEDAARFIRNAILYVNDATRLSHYPVDADGNPTDAKHIKAFRDAVCQQVVVWKGAGVDPDKGVGGQTPAISSQSAGGGSVSYTGTQSTQELGKIATTLCEQSRLILRDAGLDQVWVYRR